MLVWCFSFHVGSGARDSAAFAIGIAHARRLFDVGKELGHDMRCLDLGGGYPGYENLDITFQQVCVIVLLCCSFKLNDYVALLLLYV